MVDRPPPSRFSVVERGGRLVVIDRKTGQTPLSAAERMDLHDRNLGVEPIRPARMPAIASAAPDTPSAARTKSGLDTQPAPALKPAAQPATANSGKDRVAGSVAERNKRPWTPAPARIARHPAPQAGATRKTIVTGRWWDAKGPRTIELGPQGQAELTGGFMFLFFGVVIAAIVVGFAQPFLLLVGAFVLFRFGSHILGPIGAGIIDKAIAEKG